MDVLAHALWTNAAFYKKYQNQKTQRYAAVLFGLLPDFISFAPVFIYFILTGTRFNPESYTNLASAVWPISYSFYSYNFTHSLVVFGVIFLIVFFLRRGKVYWPILGWALHILLDVFTHTEKFFPTPVLFPISNMRNPFAVEWSAPWFMVANYSCIVVIYLVIFFYGRYQKK